MSILDELFNEEFSKELNEQQLNELTQPYSRTSSAINRTKSAVKGLVGGGQYEQGAEQAGQIANRYFMDFKRYIGSKYGRKPSYVTFDDVKNFMDAKKLDSSALGNNQNMTYTPKDVANVLLKSAQEQVSNGLVPPAQQSQGSAPGSQPNQPQPAPNGQGNGSNQPGNGQSTPSNAPSTSTGTGNGVLAGLSPTQRT